MSKKLSNIDIVRAIQDGTADNEMETGLRYYNESTRLREAPSLPYGGTYYGHGGMKEFLKKHHETWSEHTLKVHRYIDAGDQVICLVELMTTSRATGKKVNMLVTEWWTLKDGIVTDIHEFYFDTAAVVAATQA